MGSEAWRKHSTKQQALGSLQLSGSTFSLQPWVHGGGGGGMGTALQGNSDTILLPCMELTHGSISSCTATRAWSTTLFCHINPFSLPLSFSLLFSISFSRSIISSSSLLFSFSLSPFLLLCLSPHLSLSLPLPYIKHCPTAVSPLFPHLIR